MKATNPLKVSNELRDRKDTAKKWRTQARKFYNYLRRHTATCSMAARALKLPQKNLTRYKAEFEKNGLLWQVYKDNCKLTGFPAWYLTTDETKAPNPPTQLKMWESNNTKRKTHD